MLWSILEKKISKLTWIVIIAILLVAFIAVSIPMSQLENDLKAMSGYGVLDLEFMWTVEQAEAIMVAWGSSGIQKELTVTWLDYIYMFCYGTFFAICNILVVRKAISRQLISVPVQIKYKLFTFLPIVDMLFDAVENVNLLVVLYNPSQIVAINPWLASFCASIKFGLLFLHFLLFFVGLIRVSKASPKNG